MIASRMVTSLETGVRLLPAVLKSSKYECIIKKSLKCNVACKSPDLSLFIAHNLGVLSDDDHLDLKYCFKLMYISLLPKLTPTKCHR